ncbi:MAG: serine/threonine protein kinase [Phycisphaera sp.]|nr:MAG: serine/threonine protein kinase [Phycisphaera sp.]
MSGIAGPAMIGRVVLGRYRTEHTIAVGGQATLYKGVDTRSGEPVAIKQLSLPRSEPARSEEIGRAKLVRSIALGHPNLIDTVDGGEQDGDGYLVMPFVEGRDLERVVRDNGGPLRAEVAVSLVTDVLRGAGALHKIGLVHRDIKPGNVLVTNESRAVLIDPGLCTRLGCPSLSSSTSWVGTAGWMPPEQAMTRRVDERADIYSCGALLYLVLTANLLADGGDTQEILDAVSTSDPVPPRDINPGIPGSLESACLRMLARDPRDRPGSAEEAIRLLSPRAQRPPRCLRCGRPSEQGKACGECTARPSGSLLEFDRGPLAGELFVVPLGIYSVGRDQLKPNEHEISRKQMDVRCTRRACTIADAGSVNTVTVDGHAARSHTPITQGSRIRFGSSAATCHTV